MIIMSYFRGLSGGQGGKFKIKQQKTTNDHVLGLSRLYQNLYFFKISHY